MSYKILVLEDNELLVETLEELLKSNSYDVKTATSGSKALSLVYKDKFDLYLLDVKLPDISGFEFLKNIRELGDKTPAIFLTSLNDQESLAEGFKLGGDDYIKKPFDLNELLLRIKAVLSRTTDKEDTIEIGNGFVLDKSRKRLFKNEVDLNINLKDFELLELLEKILEKL